MNARHELRKAVLRARRIDDPAVGVVDLADAIVDEIAASLPWLSAILSNRVGDPRAAIALAGLLADEDEENVPPALRVIAERFLESRYVNGRPRARTGDPETSVRSADEVSGRGPARPGGKVHRILSAYAEVQDVGVRSGAWRGGATSREIEDTFKVREAHKRTSELLQDGLVSLVYEAVVQEASCTGEAPLVRNGGRVLAITPRGREELARLDRLAKVRREAEEARLARRAARERRRQERGVTSS